MAQPTLAVAPNRHIDLNTMARLLNDQKARAVDIIAGAAAIQCVDGRLVVQGTLPQLGSEGVTLTAGTYTLTDISLGGVGDKLGVPVAYLRRMASDNVALLDANVNGWLTHDERRFLVRCLHHDTAAAAPGDGVARAFLSDRFLRIDNLDVLMAALDGIRQAGVAVEVASCDLTERRMYVRFVSPEVQVMAPDLLRNYRSPFDGRRGSDLPVISGGFMLTNSETGFGRYTVAPWLRVEVCRNGQTVDRGVLSRTHIGSRITDTDGIINPSSQTMRTLLELITAQTTDAVRAYLDVDFVTRAVQELEKAASTPVAKPDDTIKMVSQKLRYTEEQQQGILAHFISSGDVSAGGVMQAVTSYGRSVADADAAYRMETTATQALHLAAAAA
ncbi:DUF932 domain-containing protein [Couchioplanes azureus]|uniref:DUF932 domain-containing protein n=1 Tax=Couchioplanes caeruleus TaxID=56438 RepID=UPI001670CE0A|nr:DUF932 domain-containing protein [Couchioplanes caeruleus]GGQ83559.1 hypothetical protein GCM10010166_62140 [Couchioplanes caeruleus subsp. azureus]